LVGHLHGDHFGDVGSMFVAGGIAGRFSPLRIWGPSGATPELSTAAAIDAMEKMFAWDLAGRLGQTDVRGFTPEAALQVGTQIHTALRDFCGSRSCIVMHGPAM
jgi:hypothetical protein